MSDDILLVASDPGVVLDPTHVSCLRDHPVFLGELLTSVLALLGNLGSNALQVVRVNNMGKKHLLRAEVFRRVSESPNVFGNELNRPAFGGTPQEGNRRTLTDNQV